MKQHQKPCIKTRKVIDKATISKTMSEIKPVKSISKNLQSFLEISHMQKKVLSSLTLQD